MFSWVKDIFKSSPSKAISDITPFEEENTPWWGNVSVKEEQSHFWKIDDLIICLDRYNQEWHIAHYKEKNGDAPNAHKDAPVPKEKFKFKTFASKTGSNEIHLKPSLPNRSLMTRIDRERTIAVNEDLILFQSTPVWVKVEVGKPQITLDEIPTKILSDTWSGKNTLEGELCYSSLEQCTPRLLDLKSDVIQVITPVLIMNRSKHPLPIKEVRLPLNHLAVYSDPEHHLWTEQIIFYYEGKNAAESFTIKKLPKSIKEMTLLTPARSKIKLGRWTKIVYPFN